MNIYVSTFEKISNDYILKCGPWGNIVLDSNPESAGMSIVYKKGTIFRLNKINDPDGKEYFVVCKEDVPAVSAYVQDIGFRYQFDESHWIFRGSDQEINDAYYAPAVPNDLNTPGENRPYRFVTKGVCNDYISLIWEDNYYGVGTFTLTVLDNDINRGLFSTGRYLLIEKTEHIMIIEKTVVNSQLTSGESAIEITGRSLESILDRRVAFPGVGLNTVDFKSNGGLVKAVKHLINGFFIDPSVVMSRDEQSGEQTFYYPERNIPFLNISNDDQNDFPRGTPLASVNRTVSKDNLLNIIQDICQKNRVGFKIIPKQWYDGLSTIFSFHVYQGHDKSYTRVNQDDPLMVFSPIFGNVDTISLTKDDSAYKNFIFCAKEQSSDGYIDLSASDTQEENSSDSINIISNVKSYLNTKFSDGNVARTCAYFIAVAASKSDLGYTETVTKIGDLEKDNDGQYAYPNEYFNGELEITYKMIIGSSGTKTNKFTIGADGWIDEFRKSTAYGWLTSNILTEAIDAMNNSRINTLLKLPLKSWFDSLDQYTSSYSSVKWLCATYETGSKSMDVGLERREAFVDDEEEEDDDWTTADQIAFSNSTKYITEKKEDEESDEEVLERLTKSARTKSGEYRKKNEIDVKCNDTISVYRRDYDIGDLVQIDDGRGNMERYLITSETISSDTSNGDQTIPNFAKYERIPENFVELDNITLSQMILPATFDKASNIEKSIENNPINDVLPWFIQGDFLKSSSILNDRHFKMTEIEIECKREKNPDGSTELADQVSIVSKKGLISQIDNYYNSEPKNVAITNKHPLNVFREEYNENYLGEENLIYDFDKMIYAKDADDNSYFSITGNLKVLENGVPKESYTGWHSSNPIPDSDFYKKEVENDEFMTLTINKPEVIDSEKKLYSVDTKIRQINNEQLLSKRPLQQIIKSDVSGKGIIDIYSNNGGSYQKIQNPQKYLGLGEGLYYDIPSIHFKNIKMYYPKGFIYEDTPSDEYYELISEVYPDSRFAGFVDILDDASLSLATGRFYTSRPNDYRIGDFVINSNTTHDAQSVYIAYSKIYDTHGGAYINCMNVWEYTGDPPTTGLPMHFPESVPTDKFEKHDIRFFEDFINDCIKIIINPHTIYDGIVPNLNYYYADAESTRIITSEILNADLLGKMNVSEDKNIGRFNNFYISSNVGNTYDICHDGVAIYFVVDHDKYGHNTNASYLFYRDGNALYPATIFWVMEKILDIPDSSWFTNDEQLILPLNYGNANDYFLYNSKYYYISNETIGGGRCLLAKVIYNFDGSVYSQMSTDLLKNMIIDNSSKIPNVSEGVFNAFYYPSDGRAIKKIQSYEKCHGLYNFGASLSEDAGMYSDNVVLAGLYLHRVYEEDGLIKEEDKWDNKWSDLDNGVCYRSIKIYEYDATQRGYDFLNSNDDGNGTLVKQQIVDLRSKRLVHDYVPVKYIGSEDDDFSELSKEEQYGFYDIIDEVFVPINNYNNKSAKFIASGGEIKKQ